MKIYPYRTTYEKLADSTAQRDIEESGDTVVSAHFLGGRDWVLLCRTSGPTVAEMTGAELGDIIAKAIVRGAQRGTRRGLLEQINRGATRSEIARGGPVLSRDEIARREAEHGRDDVDGAAGA